MKDKIPKSSLESSMQKSSSSSSSSDPGEHYDKEVKNLKVKSRSKSLEQKPSFERKNDIMASLNEIGKMMEMRKKITLTE